MKKLNVGKKTITFLIVAMLAIILSGCSEAASADKGILVKVGTTLSPSNPVNVALKEVFEPEIEKRTNGRYNVEIYDSGQLGGEKQLYDFTRSGIVEMTAIGTVMWSEVPMMATPDFPFVFKDVAHARRVYQGEVGEYIAKNFEEQEPIKFLAWNPNGARVFSSSYPIESPEDLKGQKVRMPNNPIHVKLAESLGANVVIMDLGEVFTALEQGVVDGQDNPMSTFRQEGWFEVQDYIYETNHMVSSNQLMMSKEFWDTLSKEDQKIFEEVSLQTSNRTWDIYENSIEDDRNFLEEQGIVVETPSEEERQQLIDAAQPVYEMLYEKYDWAEDMINRIRSVE
jgi:TRAP-type transport system periplasmic protein